MTTPADRSTIDRCLDASVSTGNASATDHLVDLARTDSKSLHAIRDALMRRLTTTLPPKDLRRAAELLAEVEHLRRQADGRLLTARTAQVAGLRRVYDDLTQTPPAERPYAVTRQLCTAVGFRKSVYSPASRNGWVPTTIAFDESISGDFRPLKRAIDDLTLPPGAAPREEEVMRTGRPVVVDPADVYTDTYRPLVELSRPRGYLVMPIVSAGRTTAILHADHHDADLQPADLDALSKVATLYALVDERSRLTSAITARTVRARDALRAFTEVLDEVEKSRLTFADVLSAGSAPAPPSGPGCCGALTAREHEVFILLALGRSAASIADELVVAENTVRSHVKRIYQKLDISSRAEAAVRWRQRHPEAQ